MKAYPVDLAAVPSAGEPLTALYLASRTGPVNGKSKPRAKLAKLVSGSLSALLRSGTLISVRPRSESIWEVVYATEADNAASRLFEALRAEMSSQGLNIAELARRSGISHPHLSRLLSGQRGDRFSFDHAVALLAAVGKDLSWFQSNYLNPERK